MRSTIFTRVGIMASAAAVLLLAACDETAMTPAAAPAAAAPAAAAATTPAPSSAEAQMMAQRLAAVYAPRVGVRNSSGAFIRSATAEGGTMRLEWLVPVSPRNTDQEWERSLERLLREEFNRDFCANGDGQAYYATGAKVQLTALGRAGAVAGSVLIQSC